MNFRDFFIAVYGYAPFPWQEELAREVSDRGWVRPLALPTAAGKTTVIDIAVFTLALQAGRPAAERSAPMRVFFIIDRRLVVDQVTAHARRLQGVLNTSADLIVRQVAENLRSFGNERPLDVAAMRGGMYRDDSWAATPNQPTVCVSTVDQVGSRLLFRGYGLTGSKSRVIHAGLVGNDALLVIDEAHLSQPLIETLKAVREHRARAETPIASPFAVVEMTATPRSDEPPFRLTDADYANAVLAARLDAPKPTELRAAGRDFEGDAVKAVREMLEAGAKSVGVIVNRVASARRLFDILNGPKLDTKLLTGRIRPWDRECMMGEWFDRVSAKRKRSPDDAPIVIVATQTVEVGADLDFDAVVTEAAPLSALRQRFGRLDRVGQLRQAGYMVSARGVVLLREVRGRNAGSDPVYGALLQETWDRLNLIAADDGTPGRLDFGIRAIDGALDRDRTSDRGPLTHADNPAPIMLPTYMRAWGQTSPAPEPDPDVGPFLHGKAAGESADVRIVWRADLHLANTSEWLEAVAAARPTALEGLPVRIEVARSWLGESRDLPEQSDVEGVGATGEDGMSRRQALLWLGPKKSHLVGAGGIRPGCTIVVPSSYGGSDEFGWNPGSGDPVRDVGDECLNWLADSAPSGRRRAVRLRLHPHLFKSWLSESPDVTADKERFRKALTTLRLAVVGGSDDLDDKIDDLLAVVEPALPASDHPDPEWRYRLAAVKFFRGSSVRVRAATYPGGVVIFAKARPGFAGGILRRADEAAESDDDADEDRLLQTARRVDLDDHLRRVAGEAFRFSEVLPLPLRQVLKLAGRLHDIGKRDPRFQAMLYGDPVEAAAETDKGKYLAKSGFDSEDRVAFNEASRRSGKPDHFRHEFVSVALVRSLRRGGAFDIPDDQLDLLEYLIGTHHGHGRPAVTATDEDRAREPAEVVGVEYEGVVGSASANHQLWRLGSGWCELFATMNRRFGLWGLAYLEAVLMLADHAASAAEEATHE